MIENNSVEHVTMTKLQQGNALLVVFLFFVDVSFFFRYVQPCVGTTGEGVYEGLEWLSRQLTSQS